jgi:flagellum-specific peptidoglycan hydrolase FlgJ
MTIPELYKSALEAERETGIPALFSVAQAILESGWHITPIDNSNNIYGIKYHIKKWGFVEALTTEFEDGIEYHKTLKFQKYPTLKDCIIDHNQLLLTDIKGANAKCTYKQCLEHFKKDQSLEKYVRCISLSYATDPRYAEKVLNIISILKNKYHLQEVKNEVGINDEVEKAKKVMMEKGIFKPYGKEAVYWETHITREDLAVILYRLTKKLQITLGGDKK